MNVKTNTGAKKSQLEVELRDAATGLPGEALGLVFVFFGFADIGASKFNRIGQFKLTQSRRDAEIVFL